MRLTLASHTDQLTHLECEGDVTQHEFTAEQDPLESVLGPNIYRHCVLLSLDKTTYIDSSGVSWLLHGHKEFERSAPDEHQEFLEFLHIPSDEIKSIRRWSAQ